jgi:hypothetical protein
VVPPIATLLTVPVPPVLVDAVPVVEAFAPSATEPLMVDEAFVPRARAPAAEAMAAFPIAIGAPFTNWTMAFPVDVVVLAVALLPIAIAPIVLALALCPTATPLLKVPCPMATVFPPKAVDSDETLLLVVLKPVEVDVDSEVNWPKFTASVGFAPAATLVRVTGVVAPGTPKITFVCVPSVY